MLTSISASNYRSFRHLRVDLAPLTLLVGPNNSGKSSVISLIRLLSQTIESNDPNVRLLLNGGLGDFGTYKDLIHGNETRRHLDISFTIDPGKSNLFPGSDKKSLTFSLNYKYRAALKEVILKRVEVSGDGKHRLTAEYSEDSERFILKRVGGSTLASTTAGSTRFRGFDVRNFLPRYIPMPTDLANSEAKAMFDEARAGSRNSHAAFRALQSVEYVGAMRAPPSRTYLFTGERRLKVGANGEHAISMLAMDSIRRGSKSRGIRQGVVKWLGQAGIASDLKIVSLSDRYFEVHVQHPITQEYENFADVGYGNSQVIPVLVAGMNSSPDDCFIVEEPEIHLHPKAQAELGDFFVDLTKRGVQSIVETHSEYMIVRLQRQIAAGNFDPSALRIYYVDPKSTGKSIVALKLNSKGAFLNEWPGGFFPERLNEARELAVARSKQDETVQKE